MFTSERIPHDSGMYHERIYKDNQCVALVRSNPEDLTEYWWLINGSSIRQRGFTSVADCKADLFRVIGN